MEFRSQERGRPAGHGVFALAARAFTIAAVAGAIVLACGQEDPTFRPDGGGTVPQGSIAVSSSVPGATIALDGAATGLVTPDTLLEVNAGSHEVGVFLAGFFPPDDQTIDVVADSLIAVRFELARIPVTGAIAVSAPYPAAIFVDGAPTGLAAPEKVHGLAPGEHVVTLALPGFRSDPTEERVTVVAGQVAPADFDLFAPKIVVCEDFSNFACNPCPAADAALQEVLLDYEGRALSVNPHTNFPGSGDPYFQLNPTASNARIFFNQVASAPRILIDGVAVPQGPPWTDPIRAAIEGQVGVAAPLAIGVEAALGATEYRLTVDVWAVTPGVPANLLLFTYVVEQHVVLDPPGPNGQSEYRNVMRHLFPTPDPGAFGGESLGALGEGDHITFEYTWPLPGGDVDPNELAVVTFAQEDGGDRRVVQTGVSYWP